MEQAAVYAHAAPQGGRPADAPVPVTVAISRHIKPGKVAEYDAWLHEMTLLASRAPGYHGSTVLRPRQGGDRPEYTAILHFDTEENLAHWLEAPERHALLERATALADDPDDEVVFEPGMDYWFTPHEGAVPLGRAAPPRWKMTIVLASAVFALAELLRPPLTTLFVPLLPPVLVRAVVIGSVVSALSYVVLPWLTRRLAFWLAPKPGPASR